MKKIVYLTNNISAQDILVGPSKFARFEGLIAPRDPHSSYSIHNDIESLHNLDAKLVKENPSWSSEQVRAERHFRWKNGMGQAQIDTFKAERRRDETMQSKEAYWDVVDGDLVNPNYGSFQKMIDNAQSDEERASLIDWRDASINAESGSFIISLDYHNGTEIRYADAWEKDGNGRIQQKIRADIANKGDLNGQQALKYLSKLANTGGELVINQEHNVGFVVIKPSEGSAKNIAKELSLASKTIIDVGKSTGKEIVYTARSVRHYIEKRAEKKNQQIPKENMWPVSAPHLNEQISAKIKKEKHSPDKKMSMPVSDREVAMVAFASEKKIQPAHVTKEVKKSIARHERKMEKKIVKITVRKTIHEGVPHGNAPKELAIVKKSEKKKQSQKRKEAHIVFSENIHVKKQKRSKEAIFLRKIEVKVRQRLKKEKVVRLLAIVKRFIHTKERLRRMSGRKLTMAELGKTERRRKKQEHVVTFSIAILWWVLITKPDTVLTNEYKLKKKEKTRLFVKEPTPWLLLAIIWHLAMIREIGIGTTQQPKQKKVKKKTYYPQFAPRGVIFAYAS